MKSQKRFKKSRGMVLAVLTVIFVLSFVLSAFAQSIATFQGYTLEPMAEWKLGVLQGWNEDNWVPFRVRFSEFDPRVRSINIEHDYMWLSNGAKGLDGTRNFYIGDESGNPIVGATVSPKPETYKILLGALVFFQVADISLPPGGPYYLYWEAHLATDSSNWSGMYIKSHTSANCSQYVYLIPPRLRSSISGIKYNDLNGNGTKDSSEFGLEGWTIKLDGTDIDGNPVHKEIVTGPGGSYEFKGLKKGTYTISEVLKDGWVQTAPQPVPPGTHTITIILDGSDITSKDFGNKVPRNSKISGYKYNDLNGNGAKDSGEPGLAGWTIKLTGPVSGETTTGSDGSYKFDNLPAGTYTVSEVLKDGWVQTAPPGGIYTVIVPPDATNINFGNRIHTSTISGYKYNDLNGNGTRDGEPGLEGWKIILDGPVHRETFTNPNGYYEFTNLPAGTYTVSEVLKDGWVQTQPGNVVVLGDSSSSAIYSPPPPPPPPVGSSGTYIVTVPPNATDKNFGNKYNEHGSISVIKNVYRVVDNPSYDEARVRYILADIDLGGPVAYYRGYPDDPNAVEAVRRWDNGIRTINSDKFERKFVGTSWLIVYKGTEVMINGLDVKLNKVVVHKGEKVKYTFKVTNTGSVPLTEVSLDDDKLGHIDGLPFNLAPGESKTFIIEVIANEDVINTVIATGKCPLGDTHSAKDSAEVDVINPKIEVIKLVNGQKEVTVHKGDMVTYTYTVKNIGDVPLTNVNLEDDKFGHIAGPFDLAPGEVRGPFTLVKEEKSDLINTVVAKGYCPLWDPHSAEDSADPHSDKDDASVKVINPSLKVEKTVNGQKKVIVHKGEIVTYSYTVTNTGDVPLTDVRLNDDKFGPIDGSFNLAVGESKTFTVTKTADADLINTVIATGKCPLGDTHTSPLDKAEVDVINPSLKVVKTVNGQKKVTVYKGDKVTYSYTVTNTGDVPLTEVSLDDDKLGHIDGLPFNLAPGESKTFTIEVIADKDVINTVTAIGKCPLGDIHSAKDSAEVVVIDPKIDIEKTANPIYILAGQTVTYTYTVTNTGNTTLYNVTVDDDVLGHVGDIPVFNPGQVVIFTKYSAPDHCVTNTVIAKGKDILGKEVSDQAQATVKVMSCITISPKTIGYWKSWRNHDYTLAEMRQFVSKINSKSTIFKTITVDDLSLLLSPNKTPNWKCQLLGVYLNVVSSGLEWDTPVFVYKLYDPAATALFGSLTTVENVLTKVENNYTTWSNTQIITAGKVLDAINQDTPFNVILFP